MQKPELTMIYNVTGNGTNIAHYALEEKLKAAIRAMPERKLKNLVAAFITEAPVSIVRDLAALALEDHEEEKVTIEC